MTGSKKRKLEGVIPAVVEEIKIKKADVPEYLQSGAFYQSLDDDDAEPFVVPGDAMKPDASLNDVGDLVHLLKSLRFWGVDRNMREITDFVLQNAGAVRLKSSLAAFEPFYPFLCTLRRILRHAISMRLDVAIETGDLEMVQYLTNKNVGPVFELTPKSTELAAKYGHVHVLQFLHEQGDAWGPEVFFACIVSGSLECAQFLHKHCALSTQRMQAFRPSILATNASVDVFIYGYQNGVNYPWDSLVSVMSSGGVERLKYFQSQNFPFPPGLTAHCAELGSVDLLKYLHSQGVPFHIYSCDAAARHGQLKALKFLHENGAAWDAGTCVWAAAGGNLSCFKYCHEKGCPWDEGTTRAAEKANSLPCLKYAHEKGCPWSSHAYRCTSAECKKYLEKNGCPKPSA